MQHSDGKLFRLFVLIRQCFLLVVSDLFYCSVMLVIDDDGDDEEECVCVYVCVCAQRERGRFATCCSKQLPISITTTVLVLTCTTTAATVYLLVQDRLLGQTSCTVRPTG